MKSRVGGLQNGDAVITIACPNFVKVGRSIEECGADLDVLRESTRVGVVYEVPQHCDGCGELTPLGQQRAKDDAIHAYDNYDGPSDGEEWSGGFAENH